MSTANDTATTDGAVSTFTFACYPSDFGDAFDAFLLDVPTRQGEDAAARRAWWSCFHLLGPQGFEPEHFNVCAWRDNAPGPLVTSGGGRPASGAPRSTRAGACAPIADVL